MDGLDWSSQHRLNVRGTVARRGLRSRKDEEARSHRWDRGGSSKTQRLTRVHDRFESVRDLLVSGRVGVDVRADRRQSLYNNHDLTCGNTAFGALSRA